MNESGRIARTSWLVRSLVGLATVGVAALIFFLAEQNRILKEELSNRAVEARRIDAPGLAAGQSLPPVSVEELAGRDQVELPVLLGRGGVIAVLTTTCPYCERTLPVWNELASVLDGEGLEFIGLSLHERALTTEYQERHDVPWPLWILSSSPRQLRVSAVPTTIAYSREGRVVGIWQGMLRSEQVADVVGAIVADAEAAGHGSDEKRQ